MKTRSEKKYTDLVISLIMSSNKTDKEKEECIKDFFNNHSYYYENLCYNVYYLSILPGTNVLSIDDHGISHINLEEQEKGKRYFDILVLNEFSPICNDVIMHIDLALNHLYEMVYAEQSC